VTDDLVSAKGLEVTYRSRSAGGVKVLHGVDVRIGRRETIGIVGESGSGKQRSAARCYDWST